MQTLGLALGCLSDQLTRLTRTLMGTHMLTPVIITTPIIIRMRTDTTGTRRMDIGAGLIGADTAADTIEAADITEAAVVTAVEALIAGAVVATAAAAVTAADGVGKQSATVVD